MLDIAIQFIQANLPIRLGFLFVSNSDIDTCKASSDEEKCLFPLVLLALFAAVHESRGGCAQQRSAGVREGAYSINPPQPCGPS